MKGGNGCADAGIHCTVLCRSGFRGGAAALERLDLVGSGRSRRAGSAGGFSAAASAGEAAAAGRDDAVLSVHGAGVLWRVSELGAAAGAGPVRAGGGVFRNGGKLWSADGAGSQGHGVSGRAAGRQSGLLWRRVPGGFGAGTEDYRPGQMAGCGPHP